MIPNPNICFIIPDERPDKEGVIFLPSTRPHKDLPNTGIIKYLNPLSKAEFKIGDMVVYDRHAQQIYNVRGEKLAQVKIEDVMAIL